MNETQTPQMQEPTTPQRPPATHPPLERLHDRKILTGLSAGLGRRFDLNPWWFRIGFLLLAPFGGLGVFLYLIGWLLVPEQNKSDSLAVELARRAERRDAEAWIGIVLVGIAALIVLGWLGFLGNGLFWAAILAVIGVLLFRGDLRVRTGDEPPPESGDPPTTTGIDAEPTETPPPAGETADEGGGEEISPPPGTPVASAVPQPPRPKKRRSLLGGITAGTALLAVGIMAVLDTAGTIEPSFADYVAVTVGVFGLGLVVGAVWGRSVALIVFGLLLLPVLFVARFLPLPLSGEFGDLHYAPPRIEEVQDDYRLAAGSLTLDLRGIDLQGSALEIDVAIGAGEIIVITPVGDPTVTVTASVGVGELVVFGEQSDGFGLVTTGTLNGSEGVLILDVDAGAGSVRIHEGR